MRCAIGSAILVFGIGISALAADLKPDELVRTVSQVYEALESFHFELTITTELTEGPQKGETYSSPVVIAMSDTGQVRAEINDPDASLHAIFDGETTWLHVPQLNQYSRRSAEELPVGMGPTSIATDFGTQYASLVERVENATIVGHETLGDRECVVMEVTYPDDLEARESPEGPITLWIDKQRHIVLKERFRTQMPIAPTQSVPILRTMEITNARINEALPDSLFAFVAPDGALEVQPQDLFEQSFVGQPAPDFTLTGIDGEEVALSSLRGSVVLLDFWASWCGPCRIELPTVQKLHETFPDDLVVLGINNEEPGIARAFASETGITFRTLSDVSNKMAASYDVQAIPTVFVIDREGQIVEHYVGVRSEEDLLDALRRAGIE